MLKKIRIWIFLYLLSVSSIINSGTSDFKFITHKPLYFQNLDVNKIYDIYTLNIDIDEQGNPITLVHMPKHSIEYKVFIEDFLHMNERSYNNILKSSKSLGRGIYIKRAKDVWNLIALVEDTPSSIGYVSPFIYVNTGSGSDIKVINLNYPTY